MITLAKQIYLFVIYFFIMTFLNVFIVVSTYAEIMVFHV